LLCVLKGELELALVHAREAGRLATESGYFRAIVASLIDAGHVLHSLGRFTEALETIETALAQIDAHHNLRVAALDCLANILVSQGDLTRAEAVFEEITHYAPKAKAKTVLHWDTLSILWSRLELARVRNRYDEVEKLLKSGLETAKHSGDSGWLVRLQLASATLSLEAGRLESAIEPLAKAVAAETSS